MSSYFRIISHTRAILRLPVLSHGVHIWNSSPRAGFGAAFLSTMSTAKGNNAENRRPIYNPISNIESLENYVPGGYHPVMVGDVLHDRYRVVDKLGFGGYSTVWLAQDTQLKCYVAVKVGTVNSPVRETTVLRELSTAVSVPAPASQGRRSIPSPLDEFELRGPNGIHPCYTMALAECDLRTVSYSQLFPIEVARALSGGVVLAVAYLHARGYAHGDIHLRNVLVCLQSRLNELSIDELYKQYGEPETIPVTRRDGKPLQPNVPSTVVAPLNLADGKRADEFTLADTRVLLSDFGEVYMPKSLPRLGRDCHTPLGSRPPESRFEPDTPLSYPADIWSLGITIWEILGMKAIFSNEFTTLDEVTAQQVDVLGPMPPSWWERWDERTQFFDEGKRSLENREAWPTLEKAFEDFVQKYRRTRPNVGMFCDDEAAAILELMRGMLAFRPEERLTAEEVLRSKWMTKWVLPDVERSRRVVDSDMLEGI